MMSKDDIKQGFADSNLACIDVCTVNAVSPTFS